jgi:hypothetical protein
MKQNMQENLLALSMSLIGIYSSFTHNYENEAMILFIIYYFFDIQKKTITNDFILHHLLGITISFLGLYIKYNNLPREQIRQIILNMELTTPIYILCLYFENLFTKVLFFISFFYCRIYKQYNLLNDHIANDVSYILYTTYYSFFALNLYWFTIQIKKLSKPFKDPKYIFCHKIIPFIQPINKLNVLNFYSTISSYLYHEDIYSVIMNDKNVANYISPQIMVYSCVNSIVSISTIEPCYYKYSIPFHICKLFNLYSINTFNPIIDIIPIGVDTYFYFSTDAFIIYYIFILVRTMKPFYNLNPLALHILLFMLKSFRKV